MAMFGRAVGAGLLVAATPLAVPAAAETGMGTVSALGSVVTVTGTDGVEYINIDSSDSARHIEIFATTEYNLGHDHYTFTAGTGCTADPTSSKITCELESAGRVIVNAGGDVDVIAVFDTASPNTQIVVRGGAGTDYMHGGPVIAELYGEEGSDVFYTGAGPEVVRGGPGYDEVRFSSDPILHTGNGVAVSLDDQPNDETNLDSTNLDDIGSDIERLEGTAGDDLMIGNDLRQDLLGHEGNDTLISGGGDDNVHGSSGDDRIEAGLGDDQLDGGSGDDTIDGGGGTDTIVGGSENDTLTGGAGPDTISGDFGDPRYAVLGNDTIHAVDGEQDVVACEGGTDKADVDDIDAVHYLGRDVCESLVVSTTSPPPAPAPPATAAVATMTGKVLWVNRKGTATRLPLICGAGATACTGRIRLINRGATLGKGRYSLAAGDHGKVKINLIRKGRVALEKRARVRVVATLVSTQGTKITRKYLLRHR